MVICNMKSVNRGLPRNAEKFVGVQFSIPLFLTISNDLMHFFTLWDSQNCIAPVSGLATRVHLDFHRMAGALGRKIHGALTGKRFRHCISKD